MKQIKFTLDSEEGERRERSIREYKTTQEEMEMLCKLIRLFERTPRARGDGPVLYLKIHMHGRLSQRLLVVKTAGTHNRKALQMKHSLIKGDLALEQLSFHGALAALLYVLYTLINYIYRLMT
jgi:hypothetical protein